MFLERKPKFRSRKLDFARPLFVYRFDEVDDFDDFESPLRSVTQVATGVDKEEEDEHHLRQALTHQSTKTQPYYIPTPEAAQIVADYDKFYRPIFKVSKSYVKTGEDPLASFPNYNADALDEAFLETLGCNNNTALPPAFNLTLYEWIIDCLEDAAHRLSEAVVSTESIERLKDRHSALLPDEATLNRIIDHWKVRRGGRHSLVPLLRHEDLGKIGVDPYVCFRRRELKVPRKTRRSDAQITDRLKKLHLDLSSMRLMLQATIKRDRYKREALVLEREIFEKYRLVDAWRRHHKSEWPPHLPAFKIAAQSLLEPKKKKIRTEGELEEGSSAHPSGCKIAIPVAALKSFRYGRPYYPHDVGRHIQRDLEGILGPSSSLVPEAEQRMGDDICYDFLETTGQAFFPAPWHDGRPVSYRKGRGGRIIIDRQRRNANIFDFESRPIQDLPNIHTIKFHAKLLNAKDFTSMQTPVGNYNVHAVQTANQILRPMSFQAWIASTAPIVSSLTGSRVKSPKKKRSRDETPALEVGGGSLGGGNNGSGGGQITVKVKSQPPKETPRRGTGARFTPHGLAPEGVKDAPTSTTEIK